MRAEPKERREIPVWRHYEMALEKASLLLALTRCSVGSHERFIDWRSRQRAQVVELFHEFCVHARASIELADRYEPGVKQKATEQVVSRGSRIDLGYEVVPISQEPLWKLLGHVIHARKSVARERVTETPILVPKGGCEILVVAVEANWDKPGVTTNIVIEDMLETFYWTGRWSIESALKKAESPHWEEEFGNEV